MITEDDFPALYRAAQRSSSTAQERFLRATKLRLFLLLLAGLMGTFAWHQGRTNVAAVLGAAAFGLAIIVEVYLLRVRPERAWYDGRAAAESAKTLTWRFVVGGRPFPRDEPDDGAENYFLDRLRQVADDLKNADLRPIAEPGDQITPLMRALRAATLPDRKEQYSIGRIEDQGNWYTNRARYNEDMATKWAIALVTTEAAGLIGAILRAAAVVEVEVLALAGAAAAAITAWVQTKQHQMLARAYGVAYELSDIRSRAAHSMTEEEWSAFVDQAEEAVSREHTLWRASHS